MLCQNSKISNQYMGKWTDIFKWSYKSSLFPLLVQNIQFRNKSELPLICRLFRAVLNSRTRRFISSLFIFYNIRWLFHRHMSTMWNINWNEIVNEILWNHATNMPTKFYQKYIFHRWNHFPALTNFWKGKIVDINPEKPKAWLKWLEKLNV